MKKKSWTAIARTEFAVHGSNNHHFVKLTLDTDTPFTVCKILFLLGQMSIFCLWNYRCILLKWDTGIELFCEAILLVAIGSETQQNEVSLLLETLCRKKFDCGIKAFLFSSTTTASSFQLATFIVILYDNLTCWLTKWKYL